jgi:hypothetical protein
VTTPVEISPRWLTDENQNQKTIRSDNIRWWCRWHYQMTVICIKCLSQGLCHPETPYDFVNCFFLSRFCHLVLSTDVVNKLVVIRSCLPIFLSYNALFKIIIGVSSDFISILGAVWGELHSLQINSKQC